MATQTKVTSRTNSLISRNFAAGEQTFIIPLTFTDIRDAIPILPRISYGGDIWELRVDLLSPSRSPLSSTNLPSLDYVKAQVQALQSMSKLPILFTIRTKSQGGKFPDDKADEALALMLMAVECGIEYVDVEVEWPESVIGKLMKRKKGTELVASFHDWTGNIRWTSQLLRDKFAQADAFGGMLSFPSILRTNPFYHYAYKA
jgi:3-dehydroquinate dehydratase type I